MELTVTQQERPWDRPFWKPVHGKEGVFAYLVLIHVLAVVGLVFFPVPNLKVVGMTLLSIAFGGRSEEHTSELQSQSNLVCRLLLEKKKIPHFITLTHI